MKRSEKEAFVSKFNDNIKDSSAFALMAFEKLSVEAMTEFRLALRKKGVRVQVVKNTLAKRVFGKTDYSSLNEHFQGPTLVAYADKDGDAVETAKAIYEWVGRDGLEISVKGGVALGDVLSESQMSALSKLPGREQMLTGFLFALQDAPRRVLYAAKDMPQKMGYALAALKDKKEKEGAA